MPVPTPLQEGSSGMTVSREATSFSNEGQPRVLSSNASVAQAGPANPGAVPHVHRSDPVDAVTAIVSTPASQASVSASTGICVPTAGMPTGGHNEPTRSVEAIPIVVSVPGMGKAADFLPPTAPGHSRLHPTETRRLSTIPMSPSVGGPTTLGSTGMGGGAVLSLAQSTLVPPLNFDMVAAGVYRSGHPNERNFEFLKRLGLRSIVYLASEEYRPNVTTWAEREGVKVYHFHLMVNKEPFAEMDHAQVATLLSLVQDATHHPMLLHCNKGKYRVGCVVACLRRLQQWSHTSIFEEFERFAGKGRFADLEFIETFDIKQVTADVPP